MNKVIDLNNKTILISRTDSIGDVILTIPMCIWIKKTYPASRIIFLGDKYTRPVLECVDEIDEIIEWSTLQQMPEANKVDLLRCKKIDICLHVFPRKEIATLARKAKIEHRVGTSHRAFHLLTCNHRLNFSRKNSDFHEAQLNFELLRPYGIETLPSIDAITEMMQNFKVKAIELPAAITEDLQKQTKKVILHPKSQGSAMEWPIEKYIELAETLLTKGYSVYFTGTENDGNTFRGLIPIHENCMDTTGKMNLDQLIVFISKCDVLVACSTGPLHIAGVLNLHTIGLFSQRRPIHPGRWKALGKDVHILVNEKEDTNPKAKTDNNTLHQIEVKNVLKAIEG